MGSDSGMVSSLVDEGVIILHFISGYACVCICSIQHYSSLHCTEHVLRLDPRPCSVHPETQT